jgi:hypothetical protein
VYSMLKVQLLSVVSRFGNDSMLLSSVN